MHLSFVINFEFFTLDGEEITVSLYLYQNSSIINVKESNFVWQGKITIVVLLPHGAKTNISMLPKPIGHLTKTVLTIF